MRKSLTIVIQLLATGLMLLGHAPAQAPAASAPPSTPASTQAKPPAKTSTAKKAPVTTKTATGLTLTTPKQKASYALGVRIATDLHRQGVNQFVDPAIAARGFKDALAGTKSLLTDDEMKAALAQLQGQVHDEQQAKAQVMGAANKKEGETFLAANKAKEGVVTLPSGLQYKILTAGTGPKPTAADTVTCNYRGTFINGQEFDSSYKSGKPASFAVTGVIHGWTEALQLMPVGSKWQLFIPSDLAYGDAGRPGIPPAATLIFEVELVSIDAPKK